MEAQESESSLEGDVVTPATAAACYDDDDGEGFLIKEEVLEEVMGILEMEEAGSESPSSVLWVSPFVTINGNEESCGPSFSDTSTTVMASLDIGGFCIPYLMGLLTSENVLPAGVLASSSMAASGCALAGVATATESSSSASKPGNEGSVSTEEHVGSADELVCDAESDEDWLARVLGSTIIGRLREGTKVWWSWEILGMGKGDIGNGPTRTKADKRWVPKMDEEEETAVKRRS
ncbi:uncharacterized protein [Aristolochia californica]|uniref:uncharacterized protein n=1 Tax=Aristolochia californica TaxID=171875 RepID=UPI0035E225D5